MVRVNTWSLVQLAKGSTVFQRGPNLVQFGLDATRTGIIETACAADLVLLLRATHNPISTHHLISALAELIGYDAARSLTADLVSYRILVPAESRHIALIGASPLAKQLSDFLATCGFTVSANLESTDSWVPLVAVDQLAHASAVARMARHRAGAAVPVTQIDSRVIIGPIRFASTDPCLACANAHFEDIDVLWRDTLAENTPGSADPDPVVAAAGVAAAATVIRRVSGIPDPPGVSAQPVSPGEMVVIDPFGPRPVTTREIAPHPRCRVCY